MDNTDHYGDSAECQSTIDPFELFENVSFFLSEICTQFFSTDFNAEQMLSVKWKNKERNMKISKAPNAILEFFPQYFQIFVATTSVRCF